MKKTTLFKKIVFYSGLLLFFCQSAVVAAVLPDSFRILALREKEILVSTIFNYNAKLLELKQDRLNSQEDKEWVDVKIMHIKGQERMIPLELDKAAGVLKYKIQRFEKEIRRFADLNRKHLDALLKLDLKVKQKNGNKAPSWWHLEEWLLELLYPGEKEAKSRKRLVSSEIPGRNEAFKKKSKLVDDIQEKIQTVELENWVVLISDENRLRLEVELPILFGSGNSSIAKEYKKFFRKLAWLLKPYPVKIEVAGFTDASAINNEKYASNLELGVSRAVNVVKELVNTGMNESAFKIISRGVYPEKKQDGNVLSAAMKRCVEVTVFFENNQA